MNILFYSPLQSGRSKDTESVMEGFVKNGDKVLLLTQYPSPLYHEACRKLGVECFHSSTTGTVGLVRKIKQLFFLIRFCEAHRIQVIYSQLEPANLIAVVAQFLIRAKVVLVRHHVDEVETTSTRKAHLISMIMYKLARHVAVVSRRAKEYMVNREKISAEKIHLIPLGYNFSIWPPVNESFVQTKKSQIRAAFTLITAARLVKAKRVDLSIRLLSKVVDQGIDCKLLILGEGEDQEHLRQLTAQLNLTERVYFEGYVSNVLDYMRIADMMVHFSLIDSSPAIVKEAGLASIPVVVCRDVGDCDDYIVDGVNGFLVDRDQPLSEAFEKVMAYHHARVHVDNMGKQLKESVLKNFSIETVLPLYQKLNRELWP